MRNPANNFHLAIPCACLKSTKAFYERLGCRVARQYDDRITMDFFGDQIVCHHAPESVVSEPTMYPRHFGITFRKDREFNNLLLACERKKLPFFKKPFVRFEGKPEEHRTFCLLDPSNNVLEFKLYNDPHMMM